MNEQRTVTVGPALFSFSSWEDWIATAKRKFRMAGVRGDDTLCLDAKGRVCTCGLHFKEAKGDDAYPITVYANRPEQPDSEGESRGD